MNSPFLFPPNFNKNDSTEYAWQDNVFSKEELDEVLSLGSKISFVDASTRAEGVNYDRRKVNISWLENSSENYLVYTKMAQVSAFLNSVYFQFDLYGFYEDIQYSVYNEGDHHAWHYDMPTNGLPPRKLTTIVMLSRPDEYEGGELEILGAGEPVKLEKVFGRVYVLPSYIYHRVTPVTKGVRKTLVGWVCGNRFK